MVIEGVTAPEDASGLVGEVFPRADPVFVVADK